MDDIQKCKANGLNPLQYGIANERMFEANMEETGKKRKTTFYSDLSIAEYFSIDAVKDTYNQVIKSWGGNIEYISEFCLCLNWKIWQHYKKNEPLAKVYNELWDKCQEYIYEKFADDKDALSYYYELTD